MSINDQIEAAWLAYYEELDDDIGKPSVAFHSDVFTAGYLAGLRSLYVEVKPEDVLRFVPYTVLTDNGSVWDVYLYENEWISDLGTECFKREPEHRVFIKNLPSPSDLFAEGRACNAKES